MLVQPSVSQFVDDHPRSGLVRELVKEFAVECDYLFAMVSAIPSPSGTGSNAISGEAHRALGRHLLHSDFGDRSERGDIRGEARQRLSHQSVEPDTLSMVLGSTENTNPIISLRFPSRPSSHSDRACALRWRLGQCRIFGG